MSAKCPSKCLTPDIAETLNDWPPRPTAKSPLFQSAFRITPTADQMRERYDWPEAFSKALPKGEL